MSGRSEPLSIPVRGAEYEPRASSWGHRSAADERAYWTHLARYGQHVKRESLRRGLDVRGRKLRPVKPRSRPDGAAGPPLTPHHAESRTRKWLTFRMTKAGFTLFWQRSWGRILGYHAYKHGPRRLPVRDVIGLSPADVRKIKDEGRRWWRLRTRGSPPYPPIPLPATRPRPKPPRPIAMHAMLPPMPPAAVAPLNPGLPLRATGRVLPGLPIAHRLAAYELGDRKVARILELGAAQDRRRREIEAEIQRISAEYGKLASAGLNPLSPEATAGFDAIAARIRPLRSELLNLHLGLHEQIARELAVLDPLLIEAGPDHSISPLTGGNPGVFAAARRFVGKLTASQGRGPMVVGSYQIPESAEQRAYYRFGVVSLKPNEQQQTAVHELGHALDDLISEGGQPLGVRCVEFLNYRVGDEPLRKLADILPTRGYAPHEEGRKDKFTEGQGSEARAWYCGKPYGPDSSEILSMGLEQLYADPIQFARGDPEYLKFVLGILDGSLR